MYALAAKKLPNGSAGIPRVPAFATATTSEDDRSRPLLMPLPSHCFGLKKFDRQ